MSTIKVDTYLTRGGASEIAIDKLKGVTAAGSMLVVGEGGTVTTNLQQGLAKHWMRLDGSGTVSLLDSFNASGLTDGGSGKYTPAFTNNMSNANYSVQLTASVDHDVDYFFAFFGDESGQYPPPTTSAYTTNNGGSGGGVGDTDGVCGTVNGDLA